MEGLVAELKKRKIGIPPETMTELRSARTLVEVYRADPSHSESIMAIEGSLLNLESTLMNIGKEKFGEAFAETWLEKLEEARKQKAESKSTAQRFVVGYPKGEHWIRVLPSDEILKEDVERLAEKVGLSSKMQEDGYVLVYGSEERIKDFVKMMAEKCHETRKG